MADKLHVTLESLNSFTICSKEAPYPGHNFIMLIEFGVILTSHFHMVRLKIGHSAVFLYN